MKPLIKVLLRPKRGINCSELEGCVFHRSIGLVSSKQQTEIFVFLIFFKVLSSRLSLYLSSHVPWSACLCLPLCASLCVSLFLILSGSICLSESLYFSLSSCLSVSRSVCPCRCPCPWPRQVLTRVPPQLLSGTVPGVPTCPHAPVGHASRMHALTARGRSTRSHGDTLHTIEKMNPPNTRTGRDNSQETATIRASSSATSVGRGPIPCHCGFRLHVRCLQPARAH